MQNLSATNTINQPQPQQQTVASAQAATTPVTQSAQPVQAQVQSAAPQAQVQSPLQSSGVNIVIYNPSVNPSAGTVANSNNTYGVPMAYPQNYYLQQPQQTPSSAVAQSYLASSPVKEEPKTEKKEETHKEDIVQLTDDYIRTLENYLNNPNQKIREMGMKEVMARFKEHKSRLNDVALTNLLNKSLQDGSKGVRFLALATLDAGYAQGDDLTRQLLSQMQASKEVFGEDAMMASQILLKNAGNKVEVEVPGPKPETKGKSTTKKAENK